MLSVADEPAKSDRAVLHDPAAKILPRLLCYFLLQCLPGHAFCQLRLEAEDDGNNVCFSFVGNWVQDRPAVVAVPLLATENDPPTLVRFTHFIPQFLWGNKWVAPFYTPSFYAACW